ncbi:MAG: hypothetical protein IRY99_21310 [Isosphaeraceae bacterium]|nr:hypothetical protein [Isosphaeraceae bacterium]
MTMDTPQTPQVIVPNPGLPKTIGILNIVFGSLLLLYGLCMGASTLFMPALGSMMQAQQKKLEAEAQAKHKAQIEEELADLDRREAEAETEQEKAEIQAQREQVKKRPPPLVPNTAMGFDMVKDPTYLRFIWGEIITGLLLNVPLLISGIALLGLREWGRKLALWIAGLKLVRLVILLVLAVTMIAPGMARRMDREFAKLGAQIQQTRPGGPPIQPKMKTMSAITGAAMTAQYVFMYGLGMVYPVIVLWVLTRPRAKYACLAVSKPGPAPLLE